jgi:hypothetical protein
MIDHIQRWQELGKAGVIVSIAYGPMPNGQLVFSVDAMCTNGDHFARPYAAETFEQAVEIAVREALKRGWLPLNN